MQITTETIKNIGRIFAAVIGYSDASSIASATLGLRLIEESRLRVGILSGYGKEL